MTIETYIGDFICLLLSIIIFIFNMDVVLKVLLRAISIRSEPRGWKESNPTDK